MFEISKFGKKFSQDAGILSLMDDLGKANASTGKVIMMGGGNPAHIDSVQEIFREEMKKLTSEESFKQIIGNYSSPEGNPWFQKVFAGYLVEKYGWDISEKNICITSGGQSSFFFLFNLFAGEFEGGRFRKILFPLSPEYIGYSDLGLSNHMFVSYKPKIELIGEHYFKYKIDFDSLKIDESIGAICVSRPTNPSGNVLTDSEMEKLIELAEKCDIPLIIDSAYGNPFPGMIFSDVKNFYSPNIIHSFSLSKLGLPGLRTGIIVADPKIVRIVSSLNSIVYLAPGNQGQYLTGEIFRDRQIDNLSQNIIRSYYKSKSEFACGLIEKYLSNTVYRIHKSEGALFLWLWFPDLPGGNRNLYERLKQRNVIIVSGDYFFPGLEEDWEHKKECIRVSYAGNSEDVEEGIRILSEEVIRVYSE
ncbi:MAG: valine--pyruvate transaminase [Leptospiraceae bacterium]|nr:valine--pyruvate transaminase [Leptospiraceae bacterium]MCP5511040.1 valine--pyruvate transaminase [Leptospiraceae bacterium]